MTTQCSYCLTPEGSIIVTPKQIAEVAAAWISLSLIVGTGDAAQIAPHMRTMAATLHTIGLLPSEDPLCRP